MSRAKHPAVIALHRRNRERERVSRDELHAWRLGRAYGNFRRALDADDVHDRAIILQVTLESLLSSLTRDELARYTRAETLDAMLDRKTRPCAP